MTKLPKAARELENSDKPLDQTLQNLLNYHYEKMMDNQVEVNGNATNN